MTEHATNGSLHFDELAGKRVALIGFTPEQASPVQTALEGTDAFSRFLPNQDLNGVSLNAFDIAVVRVDHDGVYSWLSGDNAQPRLQQQLPMLLMGSGKRVRELAGKPQAGPSDFLGSGAWVPEEFLLRALRLILAGGNAGAKSAKAPSAQPTVLIADDDSSITTLLKLTLKKAGFECHVAADGGVALEMARKLHPDLIILDINMPHRDGFEVLSMLRQQEETAAARVLLLTACEQEVDVLRGFGLGADDYVVKPFNPMEISARVKRLVGRPQ